VAALSLLASLARPLKLVNRHADAIVLGAGRAVSDSGAGPCSTTGVPGWPGSGSTARCGARRLARASHAAAISTCERLSAGERFSASQLRGESSPPATSQLRRLFVLSATLGFPKLFVA
jgi:hypothetical protein